MAGLAVRLFFCAAAFVSMLPALAQESRAELADPAGNASAPWIQNDAADGTRQSPHDMPAVPAGKIEQYGLQSLWKNRIAGAQTGVGRPGDFGIPRDLDPVRTKYSDHGLFRITLRSNDGPVGLNRLQTWVIQIESAADGELVDTARVELAGGMPTHNHGFPTRPAITKAPGTGEYLIDGLMFNMFGWWQLMFGVADGDQTDTVTFDLAIEPE